MHDTNTRLYQMRVQIYC